MTTATLTVPRRTFLQTAVLAILLLPTGGCQEGMSRPASARGKIFYRGVALAGASLVFTPDPGRGGSGPQARAESQADGSFVLQTGQIPGAMPGWYRITAMALEPLPAPVPGEPPLVPRSLLPDKYRDPELSGLSCEIKAGVENTITLNLE